MSKLVKVNKELYATEDLKYTLKKEFKSFNGRVHRIWKLYKDGNYIAMPESVKRAKEIIKENENS